MVVGHTHLHGVRVGLTEIGLGVVGQIVAVLIPVKRVSGRRVFDTVDMALSVRLLLEQFPATTRYLVGTWCDVWLANTDKGSWQHNLRCLDVLDERNTALEHDVDVHHMTLTDRGDVCTRSIGLLIVILVNDSNNLLLREVEDVREAANVQRTSLCRSNTVDGEVRLPVGQTVEVALCDNETYRNIVVFIVSTGFYSINASNACYSYTFGVLTDLICLAAVVIFAFLLIGKGQCSDIGLIRLT